MREPSPQPRSPVVMVVLVMVVSVVVVSVVVVFVVVMVVPGVVVGVRMAMGGVSGWFTRGRADTTPHYLQTCEDM